MKEPELVAVPDYDDVSEFLVPAHRRDLKVGLRLSPEEVRVLCGVMNHTLGRKAATYEGKGGSHVLIRLEVLGFVESAPVPGPPWSSKRSSEKRWRITERGALRLLDPEAMIAHEIMER